MRRRHGVHVFTPMHWRRAGDLRAEGPQVFLRKAPQVATSINMVLFGPPAAFIFTESTTFSTKHPASLTLLSSSRIFIFCGFWSPVTHDQGLKLNHKYITVRHCSKDSSWLPKSACPRPPSSSSVPSVGRSKFKGRETGSFGVCYL